VTDLRGEVRQALTSFLDDPQTQGGRLRSLAESSWESLSSEAEAAIECGEDTALVRFLLTLFAERGHLPAYLARLMQERREIGRRTARLAARIIPGFDRQLARSVLECQKAVEGSPAAALLEVLEALDDQDSADEQGVRSKAASWVAKAARAQSWLKVIRGEPDPRLRADAVESLWEQGGALAAVCYEEAMRDPHHRVFANALLGLYRLGDPGCLVHLARALEHPDRAFRAAAVWAMGESRDGRFVPLLWKLRRGSDQSMAAKSAQSCEKILLAQAAAEREPVLLYSLGAFLQSGATKVRCLVLDRDRNHVQLRATDWRIRAGSQPVWQFSVRLTEGLPRLAAFLVLPRPAAGEDHRAEAFSAGIREGFRSKRSQDVLGILHYLETAESAAVRSAAAEQQLPAQLSPDVRLAIRSAASPPEPSSVHEGPASAMTASFSGLKQFKGARHVIVVLDAIQAAFSSLTEIENLSQAALRAGVQCHAVFLSAISSQQRSLLASLASETGGFSLALDSWNSLPSALSMLAAAVNRHYELTLAGVEAIDRFDVEIASQRYSGRAQWTVDKPEIQRAASTDIHWERESSPPLAEPESGSCGIPDSAGQAAVL
jgi:hypothetical protein